MIIVREFKQVGIIYHYTRYDSLLSILKDNALLISNHNYISFTRNSKSIKERLKVQIVIDGDKLSNAYKIEPFNYFKSSNREEREERVLTRKISNLANYILEINIGFDEDTFFYQMGKQEIFNNYIEQVNKLKKRLKLKRGSVK